MGAKLGGGGGGSRYTTDQNADINVTPFVDIMLVLLIIFMVSAPMATVSIKLDLPPAVPSDKPKEKKKDPTFISVMEDGSWFIGTKKTSEATLAADLSVALGSSDTSEQVLVRADADVKYEEFMKLLNTLHGDGYFKVGLINEDIH